MIINEIYFHSNKENFHQSQETTTLHSCTQRSPCSNGNLDGISRALTTVQIANLEINRTLDQSLDIHILAEESGWSNQQDVQSDISPKSKHNTALCHLRLIALEVETKIKYLLSKKDLKFFRKRSQYIIAEKETIKQEQKQWYT